MGVKNDYDFAVLYSATCRGRHDERKVKDEKTIEVPQRTAVTQRNAGSDAVTAGVETSAHSSDWGIRSALLLVH